MQTCFQAYWFRRLFLAIAGIAMLLSCKQERLARRTLSEVQTFIEDNPDSAVSVLQHIPSDLYLLPHIHAPYALLYTQAQDLAGFNPSSDTLIRYAVDYYRLLGPKKKRFMSWYYLGQVYQNEGRREAAMDAYVKAENNYSKAVDPKYIYKLHLKKSILYADTFDYSKAIEESLEARKHAKKGGLKSSEFRALLNIAIMYGNEDNTPMQTAYLDSAHTLLDAASHSGIVDYYTERAEWMRKNKMPAEQIASLLDSVQRVHPFDVNYSPTWVQMAWTYIRTGLFSKATDALSTIPEKDYSASAYAALGELLDSLQRPQESLKAYRKYVQLSDSLDLVLFRQDTRFIEERYAAVLRNHRDREVILIVIVLALSFTVFSSWRIWKRRQQHKKMLSMYENLKEEYEALNQISIQKSDVGDKAKALLGERIRALAAFFTEDQPKELRLVSSRLEALSEDRKELVETIGLLFSIYHPGFTSMLLEHGLTTTEVGLCCLYVLGFRTSEIGDIINRAGYYNISSEIRKKLPIEHVKLATWLNSQFEKYHG